MDRYSFKLVSILVPEKTFAGLSVMIIADFVIFLQSEKNIFSQFTDKDSMKHLLG